MPLFSKIQTWQLPGIALTESLVEMARDGREGNEGVVLWLGRRFQGHSQITHLVGLRGPNIVRRPDYLQIEPELLNDVADLTIELNVSLVGQIHSHGVGYETDLSITDRRYGIAVPYFLSVVAPDYGLRQGTTITDCGIHVFEPDFGFRRLSSTEAAERIQITDVNNLPFLIVGEA
jgi:hypothetical protein